MLTSPISDAALRASWTVAIGASAYATYHCVTTWKTDFRPDVAKVTVPTLVIQGDADKILPFDATGKKLAAAIPNAKLVTVSGAPHGLLWTHAEEVNKALLEFLR